MASVTPRKNSMGEIISYQIKVSRGRDALTGKQLKPYTKTYIPPEGWSAKAVERDLQKVVGEFESACNRGEVLTKEEAKEKARIERDKPTFSGYISTFLAVKAPSLAIGSLEVYKTVLARAAAVFGDLHMEDITAMKLREYFADLQMNGKSTKDGKPLQYNTILRHYNIIHSFFQSAVIDEIIPFNPMQSTKHPKPRKDEQPKERIVYDEEQVHYILNCLNKEPLKWKAVMMFAIDSGCRRGEIAGMKWSDIDLTTGRCNICRNVQQATGHGTYINTPKSGKSREIYLNRPVIEILKQWRKEQIQLLFKAGAPQSEFCFSDTGEVMPSSTLGTYIKRFGEKYNLPSIHPHALRHTMATISIANGADVVSVSKKMGHADTSMTLRVYAHANEEAQRRANDILASALYKKVGGTNT